MKTTFMIGALLLATAPLAVSASSCERVKGEIHQKILNNGVPASGFTLEAYLNDLAQQAGGKIVGHCGQGSKKIVYTRLAHGDRLAASTNTVNTKPQAAAPLAPRVKMTIEPRTTAAIAAPSTKVALRLDPVGTIQ